MRTSSLSLRLHDSVACVYRCFLGKKHVQQTCLADSCADYCGCWCLPMLLPRSFRHPLHISLVLRRNCCRSAHVVLNGHTSLGAVAHGKRGCFILSRACAQRQAGVALQVRAERQEPPRPVGAAGAARTERSAAWEREAWRGWSASRFRFWWSPSAGHVQCRARSWP